MRVTILPSSYAGAGAQPKQYLTSYLINDTLAIDAGSLGFFGAPDDQARVNHVLISHTHMDHLASLPIFLENVYLAKRESVTIHGSAAVLDCLSRDIFSVWVWLDFETLASLDPPYFKVATLEPNRPVELEGLRITPVEVNHTVPTLGFVIEDGSSAVVIASDTGPTEQLWQVASHTPNLKAVFLEVTFPNAMSDLAGRAKHLTPASFAQEVNKVSRPVRWIAVHIRARYQAEVLRELEALKLPNLEIGRFGAAYEF